jgi:LysM repeat protein
MMKKYVRKSIFILVLVVVLLALTVSMAAAKGDMSGGVYHTVSYGETLYSIGRYYGVSPYAIAQANNLYNPNYIYAGQVLYVPAGGGYPGQPGYPGYPSCGGQGGMYHTVHYGETVSSIARMYGSSVWAITQANNLYNPNYIYAGQVLYVPAGGNCGCYQNCGGYYPPSAPQQPIYYPPVVTPYY